MRPHSTPLIAALLAAGAVVAPTSALQARDYVVRPGDTLTDIASAQLGSARHWHEICDLNRDRISDCNIINPGMTLRLPDDDTAAAPAADSDAPASPEASESAETVAPAVPAEGDGAGAAEAPVPEAGTSATDTTGPAPEAGIPAAVTRTPQAGVPATPANLLPNSGTDGAVLGPLAGDGALPTGWNLFFLGDKGGTATVTGITADSIYLEITQPGSAGMAVLQFASKGQFISTAPGQDWRFAVDLATVESDQPGNWQVNMQGSQRRGDESSLGVLEFAQALPLTARPTRFEGTATASSASAELINPDLRFVSEGPWRATIRISRPEFTPLTE